MTVNSRILCVCHEFSPLRIHYGLTNRLQMCGRSLNNSSCRKSCYSIHDLYVDHNFVLVDHVCPHYPTSPDCPPRHDRDLLISVYFLDTCASLTACICPSPCSNMLCFTVHRMTTGMTKPPLSSWFAHESGWCCRL